MLPKTVWIGAFSSCALMVKAIRKINERRVKRFISVVSGDVFMLFDLMTQNLQKVACVHEKAPTF